MEWLLACGLLIGFVGILLVVFPHYRLTVALGAPSGCVLGFWLLAPFYLRSHRLHPETLLQWLIVDGALALLFALGGLFAAAAAGVPLGVVASRARLAFRLPALASIVELTASLPIALVVVGATLEWNLFGRTYFTRNLIDSATIVATGTVPLFVWLLMFYRWRARSGGVIATSRLWQALVILAALGVAVLPLRLESASRAAIQPVPLQRFSVPVDRRAPLLVIGLDGGNWRTLRPLIERGAMPTLASLVATGISGDMRAETPPYWSAPAWGAILTGHSPGELSVHEDLAAAIDGLPRFEIPLTIDFRLNPLFLIEMTLVKSGVLDVGPHARQDLNLPPIWERLHDAGIRTGVVHFPFTYPAVGQADHVVSSRAVTDFWDELGVRRGDPALVISSRGDRDHLRRWLDERAPIDRTLAAGILPPSAAPTENVRMNLAEVLDRAFELSQRMFGLSEQIVSGDPELDVLLLHLAETDLLSHAFWPYRFPEDFPPGFVPASDVERLGPVIDRFLMDLDQRLGALIRAFPRPPTVVIVSDHGAEASRFATIWHGWHSPEAIFLAAGPGVPHEAAPVSVSYIDIVPTLLDLLHVRQPQDLTGRSTLADHGPTEGTSARR